MRLFQDQRKRDTEYQRLKANGENIRRCTHRNQLLHPMYVEDYPRELSEAEKGFGNTIYKTFFGVLYAIEEDRPY